MEKLNLSNGKVKVLKLWNFLILLLFCFLPSLAFIFVSYQFKVMNVSNLIGKYPIIFNNISDFSIANIENQIMNLQSSFQKKITEIEKANSEVKKYLIDTYKDSYFLKYFSKLSSSVPNKIFLKEIFYDGIRVYIDFYEYGIDTKIATTTVYQELSKFYKNVSVQMIEERVFFSNTKYFHYILEGTK